MGLLPPHRIFAVGLQKNLVLPPNPPKEHSALTNQNKSRLRAELPIKKNDKAHLHQKIPAKRSRNCRKPYYPRILLRKVSKWYLTLKNAVSKKVTGARLNAKTSDVAMEELVLAHEGTTIEKE